MKERQEVSFVQGPRLKIKEDLLHKLSRHHLLERWKGEAEWPFQGSGCLYGAEESGEGLWRGHPRRAPGHAGQLGEMLGPVPPAALEALEAQKGQQQSGERCLWGRSWWGFP